MRTPRSLTRYYKFKDIVADFIVAGKKNPWIASQMGIAPATVATWKKRLETEGEIIRTSLSTKRPSFKRPPKCPHCGQYRKVKQ